MKIIGLAGTNGSGKDSVGRILQEDHGFLFISVTDILRAELRKHGLQIKRENMRGLGDRWRREQGLSVLVDKAVEIFNSQAKEYKGLVVSSIRNLGEVEHIHNQGGVLVWVDAEPEVRYKRAVGRARSEEDVKTYKEFIQEENDEMLAYGDEASLAMGEVKKLCDIFIDNNSNDKVILKSSIEHALREYI